MVFEIQKRRPSPEELESAGILSWPVWEKEKSVFPWVYTTEETCYFEEGRVKITVNDGSVSHFEKGDLAVFPQGLECVWEILEAVTKRYNYS